MDKVRALIRAHKLIIFSKTTCPYCIRVKNLFKQLGVNPFVFEIDVEGDSSIQPALYEISKSRTVPQVFINEKFIGGCDDTMSLNNKNQLVPLLKEAGLL
ncbi:hypothetical protein CYY_001936 [Polysphondylium violaceum]|uniref:Glutaredoxin domain-containing protein n=1 Tax=Polysphondylium violaceum TaxID=133409 RepID=A0A8J4Q109_9MYCE|nr:hypothetical protein CYY_001936 [Polysphondylium violaceum]